MNKLEFIELIAKNNEMTKKEAEIALKAVLSGLETVVENNDKVTFVGFGTFGVKERAARIGNNPKTKEKINIPASKVPFFKAGKTLKDKANL